MDNIEEEKLRMTHRNRTALFEKCEIGLLISCLEDELIREYPLKHADYKIIGLDDQQETYEIKKRIKRLMDKLIILDK